MTNPINEQIAADLQKAKATGGTRVERIRKIFQDAFSQTAVELREGTDELRSIAKGSTSVVIDSLKTKQQSEKSPVVTPVEVKIEDDQPSDDQPVEVIIDVVPQAQVAQPEIAPTQVPQAQIEIEPQTAAEQQIVSIETNESAKSSATDDLVASIRALIRRLFLSFKQSESYTTLQQQLAKLKQQLQTVDAKLTDRYGDRYGTVKQEVEQNVEKAKVWYENAKVDASENGSHWVEQKQAEMEIKLGEAGATIAHKEQEIKQILKERWQTIRKG